VTRGEVAFAIISGLLVNECCDVSPWAAVRLMRWAARLRYRDHPNRAAIRSEELAALIRDRPGKLFKLLTALGFTIDALLAAALRTGPGEVRRLQARTTSMVFRLQTSVMALAVSTCCAGAGAGVYGWVTGEAWPVFAGWGAGGALFVILLMIGVWEWDLLTPRDLAGFVTGAVAAGVIGAISFAVGETVITRALLAGIVTGYITLVGLVILGDLTHRLSRKRLGAPKTKRFGRPA
jgi:hypothetical protein